MNQAVDLKQAKYQNLKKIFKVTVESTRETLRCDRVIIYNANDLPKAGILAESVDSKYASILGQTVQDPFLGGDYLEMYCYGMSVTIDDIYTSDKNSSELEPLEKIGVRSLAIAPILVEKKLLAFLVAHQCFSSQPWDLETVNFLSEQAGAAALALSSIAKVEDSQIGNAYQATKSDQSQKSLVTEQHNSNHQHSEEHILIPQAKNELFSEVKNKIIQEPEQENILDIIVAKIRQLLNCDRVLIYSLNDSEQAVIEAESVAAEWSKVSDRVTDNSNLATGYLEEDRNGKVRAWDDTAHEDAPSWYREQLEALKVKAGLVAPIANNGRLFGLLIAHQCSDTRHWQEQEINWIAEIANHIGTMSEYTKISNGNQQLADLPDRLEEKAWTKHFAHVVQQLRQSLHTEDILQSSVGEIKTVLNCDRVLVYSLNQDSYATVIAESVASGWSKAKGKVIQDPCFEARYLEKYRDGRVRVWNNIYEAGMTSCHIEQLEELEVKANLVVPIISENKLFGLLVAQQCSKTRQWQPSEISWLTQIATQVGFALDNAQLLADAQSLRQEAAEEKIWTEYFSEAVQQIRQSLRTRDVFNASVREVRRVLNCDRVVVYSLDKDNYYGMVSAESVVHGYTKAEGKVIKDPCFEARYLEQYRDGRVRAWENIYEAGMSECYIEQLEKLEVKANLVTPIINQGKLFGLLVAHQCSQTRQWQQREVDWLTQIAKQVGMALDNAKLLEELEQSTKATQEILARAVNNGVNIQRTVQNVTARWENLSNSCQNFAETLKKVKDLSKELTQQSMNMTKVVNLQFDENNQNLVAELSDRIFTLMQELFEASAKVDPLFGNIKTEITTKTNSLELETQQLIDVVDDFQTASQKLDRVITLNQEMSNLIENISDSLSTQIESSTFTKNSVEELANITERVSQQSTAIIQSWNKINQEGKTNHLANS